MVGRGGGEGMALMSDREELFKTVGLFENVRLHNPSHFQSSKPCVQPRLHLAPLLVGASGWSGPRRSPSPYVWSCLCARLVDWGAFAPTKPPHRRRQRGRGL